VLLRLPLLNNGENTPELELLFIEGFPVSYVICAEFDVVLEVEELKDPLCLEGEGHCGSFRRGDSLRTEEVQLLLGRMRVNILI